MSYVPVVDVGVVLSGVSVDSADSADEDDFASSVGSDCGGLDSSAAE